MQNLRVALACQMLNGDSCIWHQIDSLPYTKILGFVACHTTSKQLGIGASERSWSDVKQIKDGKWSNLGSESKEKRAKLYSSARLDEAQIRVSHSNDGESDVFGNDDIK